jgi:Cu+-exporting ATPase
MRSIAVLVISCPCAMGLATPAALAVGLGRAAKKGIIFRNAGGLETFKTIRQVVFDKTGTITTGAFTIANYQCSIDENEFRQIVYSLESYSNHPIAQSISKEWKQPIPIRWKTIDEIKGLGVVATDLAGQEYKAGSYRILPEAHPDKEHNVFITRNGEPIGWIDVEDSIRPEAADVMRWLTSKGIKTILLSGDKTEKCRQVAEKLGMDEFLAEQTPQQKMDKIAALNQQMPTAMVGDGINDAPALAKATLGISLSEASQIAVQQADVILMNNGLKYLPEALGIGEHTFITIRQNLFWAFCYNIVAIPIAAFGYLTPTFSALTMGLSDVVLAVNSVRLFVKKVL